MTARAWTTLLGTAGLAALLAGCGGFVNNSCGAASRVPVAPPGVYVDDDVADGYAKYAGALAAAGSWEGDPTYGVRWCPAQPGEVADGFRPYVSRGHWTTSDRAAYGASPGTPYWTSDDGAPWTDITTHHGWWIDLHAEGSHGRAVLGSEWCWVPGLEETPARVVWRAADGFVGWAPEPPTWVDDGEDDASVGFEWTYELLATLLEDALDGYVLTGDAAQSAADATAPMRRVGEPGFSTRAPAKPVVTAARRQLVAYLHAHPNEVAVASARTAASSSHSASAAHAGATTGTSSSTSSTSSSTKHKQDSDDQSPAVVVVRLPSASILATVMMNDPVMVPVSLGRFTSGPTIASGGSHSAGSSSGGGSTVLSAHTAGHGAVSSSVHSSSHSSSSPVSHSTSSGSSSSSSSSSHKH
jgi:hypothetical protein